MRLLLQNKVVQSLLIIFSYFVLWALALFISAEGNSAQFVTSYKYSVWQNIYVAAVNLVLFHVFIPLIQNSRRKTVWTILTVIAMLFLILYPYMYWLKLGMRLSLYPYSEELLMDTAYRIRVAMFILYGVAYFALFKVILHSTNLRFRNQQLALEKKISELNYLRSQLNPHFLFNTLNNIYSLSRARSEDASEYILRLSGILRYMLYETASDWVPVSKEITMIRDYVELERIRYTDALQLTMDIEVDDMLKPVPPLLMIPLVENAFKHGVSETKVNPLLTISLVVKGNRLFLKVINSIPEDSVAENIKEGIGLKNIKRQLELLFSDHSLLLENGNNFFTVEMNINLESYAKE